MNPDQLDQPHTPKTIQNHTAPVRREATALFAVSRRTFLYGSGATALSGLMSAHHQPTSPGPSTASPRVETLPPGAIPLPLQAHNGAPVGILQQGREFMICVGSTQYAIHSCTIGSEERTLDDVLIPVAYKNLTVRDAIAGFDVANETIMLHSTAGGVSLGYARLNAEAQRVILDGIQSWTPEDTGNAYIVITNVPYVLDLDAAGETVILAAKLWRAITPPLEGRCTIKLIPPKNRRPPLNKIATVSMPQKGLALGK